MQTAKPLARRFQTGLAPISLSLWAVFVGFMLDCTSLHGQTLVPVTTPISSPGPSPSSTPFTTVTPGLPDAAEMSAYNEARTPALTIVLGSATQTSPVSAVTPSAPSATSLQPVAIGGSFPQIELTPAGPNLAPIPASISLAYRADRAGQIVEVKALGGGTLSVVDEHGATLSVTDGFPLEIGPTGAITFSFQAPKASNTYQVTTRLDNVVTTLNFLVPDAKP